jgi:protein-disulfide isomerase
MSKPAQLSSGIVIALILAQTVLLGLLVWKVRSVENRLVALQIGVGEALIAPRSAGDGAAPDVVDVDPGDGPAKGAAEPLVTIVEFSDFTCSACSQFQASLREVLEEHGDSVRLVYRYFPLAPEGKPMITALAAECSRRQDQFWPMHDALFAAAGTVESEEDVRGLAAEIGLDLETFGNCLGSEEARAVVEADANAGRSYGITGTPTSFVNGRRVRGAVPAAYLTQLIDAFEVRQKRQEDSQAGAP